MDLQQLRRKHQQLTLQQWQLESSASALTLTFNYLLDPDIPFQPKISFPAAVSQAASELNTTQQWYFHLGLAELPSYWKTACPAQISLPQAISEYQEGFWRNLLTQGLGEFYFVNQITQFTQRDFFSISPLDTSLPHSPVPIPMQPPAQPNKVLIPVGGGKDSVVSLLLLKQWLKPGQLGTFLLSPTQAAHDVAAYFGLESITAHRSIDPQLLKLNSQGYLNGHTPFSAYLAFVSSFVATALGYDHILVSNEHSANESNTSYAGLAINHQYSKSSDFEQRFQSYAATVLNTESYYSSLLRPLTELQIGGLFAQLTHDAVELRSLFRSCNRGSKSNSWCGECSKCLFAFMMLAPFIDSEELSAVFGKNLFADTTLLPLVKDLTGLGEHKPLECVGLYEESLVSLYLAMQKHYAAKKELPPVLQWFEDEVFPHQDSLETRAHKLKTAWHPHSLGSFLADNLKSAVEASYQVWPV